MTRPGNLKNEDEIFASLSAHAQFPFVERIARTLTDNGFQVVLAGGAVRDALLGRPITDLDLATDAAPERLSILFPEALKVGQSFGVTIIPIDAGKSIEVATFREDGQYLDGRHPESVSLSDAPADAKRRDFTVNALFFDLKEKRVLDYVAGLKDLHDQILRAVGEPEKRFEEDKLRILRGLRFKHLLGFRLDPKTAQAMKSASAGLTQVSIERRVEEFEKMLKLSRVLDLFSDLASFKLWTFYHPDFAELALDQAFASERDRFIKVFVEELNSLEKAKRWAIFLRPYLKIRKGGLKAQLNFIDELSLLFKFPSQQKQFLAKLMRLLEELKNFSALRDGRRLQLRQDVAYGFATQILDAELSGIKFPEGLASQPALINGEMLKQKGVVPGPKMKDLLDEAYLVQLEEPGLDSEAILERVLRES